MRVEHGHVNAMRELVNCESPAQHSTATAIGEWQENTEFKNTENLCSVRLRKQKHRKNENSN